MALICLKLKHKLKRIQCERDVFAINFGRVQTLAFITILRTEEEMYKILFQSLLFICFRERGEP